MTEKSSKDFQALGKATIVFAFLMFVKIVSFL